MCPSYTYNAYTSTKTYTYFKKSKANMFTNKPPLHHQIIIVYDFNMDILPKGQTTNYLTSTPNQQDHEWAKYTHNNLRFHVINDQENMLAKEVTTTPS